MSKSSFVNMIFLPLLQPSKNALSKRVSQAVCAGARRGLRKGHTRFSIVSLFIIIWHVISV